MELGEKLRAARLEAGLSQRALCGDVLTRNMLSQIENGSAHPSMKTLYYLASQLGKPVGYFLGDSLPASPNEQRILSARRCYEEEDWAGVLKALEDYQSPDGIFDREKGLILAESTLNLAEEALAEGQEPYARALVSKVEVPEYCAEAIARKKAVLQGWLRMEGPPLPSLDEELILRGRIALESGDLHRAVCLLEAVEQRLPYWHLLRGQVYFRKKAYREAAGEFSQAESVFPKETVPQLEVCFRELGDYQKAYEYACKGRA